MIGSGLGPVWGGGGKGGDLLSVPLGHSASRPISATSLPQQGALSRRDEGEGVMMTSTLGQ